MINTVKHLCYVLKITKFELNEILKHIDTHYYEKIELKFNKDGSPRVDKNGNQLKRVLHPSKFRLKQIQKRIHKNILLQLPLPDYAYGGVRKRDNVKNAKKHQGKKFIFTTDLKDFFPSIRHGRVFELYREYNFSPTVSRILTQLTTYKGKLPQGIPTSPTIANLVFVKTGKKLQKFAVDNQITFTSFIDDLTFSSPFDFKNAAQSVIEAIQADGFRISHNKTNYKTKDPVVTGIVVKNNNLALPQILKLKLKEVSDKTPTQIKGLQLYADRVFNSNKAKKNVTP